MADTGDYQIQEFRARLIPGQLERETASYLVFPLHDAIDDFIGKILEIRNAKKLPYRQQPPWRSLNVYITSVLPSLVHPFIRGLSKQEGQKQHRHLLVLDRYPRPQPEQIAFLIRPWLRNWVERTFRDEIMKPAGKDAYNQLLAALAQPAVDWQSIDVATIMAHESHPLTYTALPSILAARLVDKQCRIGRNIIRWRLAQEPGSNRLALVSQPIAADYTPFSGRHIEGHFVYLIEFLMHTVPGDLPHHFVHIQISCRRYVEKPVKDFLFDRCSSVMIGVHRPRIIDPRSPWPASPILVPIRIRGQKNIGWYWEDRITELLNELKQQFEEEGRTDVDVRSLIEPTALGKNPRAYWRSEDLASDEDEYYILHAEGINPKHALKTGFSPEELYEAWSAVITLCQDILEPEAPIQRDKEASKPGKIASMIPFWELHEQEINKETNQVKKTRIHKPFQADTGGKKTITLDEKGKRALCEASFDRVYAGRPLTVLLFHITQNMYELVKQLLETCYLSSRITLIAERIEDDLVTPLDTKGIEISDEDLLEPNGQDQLSDFKRALQQRKVAWQQRLLKLLSRERSDRHATFVLVEMPHARWEQLSMAKNPKRIIRGLCVESQVGSQLIQSLVPENRGDQNRVENALSDLLVRQTGLVLGDICEVYRWAGVSHEMARRLTVIGLYRYRSNKYNIDYVVAVRILPNGRIEMLLPPAEEHQWQPYHVEQLALGNIFAKTAQLGKKAWRDKQGSSLKLEPALIERFVAHVCTNASGPTLILLEATDFRNVWKQMQNPAMRLDELSFSDLLDVITREHLKDTWIVRLREPGALIETPQYVRIGTDKQTGEQKIRFADGLFYIGSSGGFPIYHSIGRGPTYGSQPTDAFKDEEGSDEAFKHQHVLEVIPFFRSPGIEDTALACVAHYLRFTPAWEMGNTVLPLPNHLGLKAIQDYLCLLPERKDEE
jgi:hypothetical protein